MVFGAIEGIDVTLEQNKVFRICLAYESGFGKGLEASNDSNAYHEETDLWYAWNFGYQEGYSKWIAKQEGEET